MHVTRLFSAGRKSLSIVVPCFNEEDSIPIFYNKVNEVLSAENLQFAYIFIDDGSSDGTIRVLRALSEDDDRVQYVRFARNFGKEAAILAGLEAAETDYVAVMDVDLQDPPELLLDMAQMLDNDECDCVATRRTNRDGEPPVRTWFARRFYQLANRITDVDMVDGARDYRMMKREVVQAIVSMREYNRFSKGIFGWVGFRTKWLSYENQERAAGSSKWSFWKLVSYAVGGIVDFSHAPLTAISLFGMVLTSCSLGALVLIIVRQLLFGDPVSGWASTISVIIFLGGAQTLFLGVLGQYISRIYLETKRRPHYIVAESDLREPSSR